MEIKGIVNSNNKNNEDVLDAIAMVFKAVQDTVWDR
jgi:hypothetical protein